MQGQGLGLGTLDQEPQVTAGTAGTGISISSAREAGGPQRGAQGRARAACASAVASWASPAWGRA